MAASLILFAPRASADPGDACVTSYEEAQAARKRGELVRSKANLRLCVAACPQALATDCDRWAGELQRELGRITIVVRARDGRPLSGVRLTVDGVERPSGEPLELDPGRHELRAEADGYAAGAQRMDVATGVVGTSTVTLQRAALAVPDRDGPSVVGPILLGGAGFVMLTAAAALIAIGHVDVSDMRDSCAPHCGPERVDTVRDLWTAGGALAAAGGGAVIAAGIWLGVSLTPTAPATGAASLRLTVEF